MITENFYQDGFFCLVCFQLDHAAKKKNSKEAEKYYAATKSAIDDVIAKLG